MYCAGNRRNKVGSLFRRLSVFTDRSYRLVDLETIFEYCFSMKVFYFSIAMTFYLAGALDMWKIILAEGPRFFAVILFAPPPPPPQLFSLHPLISFWNFLLSVGTAYASWLEGGAGSQTEKMREPQEKGVVVGTEDERLELGCDNVCPCGILYDAFSSDPSLYWGTDLMSG